MPPTQTGCPAAGTARAAVTTTLALGSHSNIVYIVNGPTHLGTLKRFDVTTGAKTEIVNLANTNISSAQLSADGQWILLVAISGRQAKLQLIRVDGQGLQTLYCATAASNGANPTSAIDHMQWTTNQRLVIFNNYTIQGENLYLLNVQSGSLQREFSSGSSFAYEPATWLDSTRAYLFGPTVDSPSSQLYILDTNKGPNQTVSNLQLAYNAARTNPSCWSFDSSYDSAKLYTSTCFTTPNPNGPGIGSMQGPSDISSQPAAGGTSTFVYQNQSLAITMVRSISNSTLLFLGANTNANTSQNGLWKIGTNGSNPVRLTATPGALNQFTQFPWSNVSRNGSMYVMQSYNSSTHISALFYGLLNGGSPTTFASISDGTTLDTVGWTTI
jgi:eukaryotic-like serine/threonine-protein kinase